MKRLALAGLALGLALAVPPAGARAAGDDRPLTQADVGRLIEAQVRTCAILESWPDRVARARVSFRGLPVVEYSDAASGEGAVWGFVFAASPAAVAQAIPEAAKPRKLRVPDYPTPVSTGVEPWGEPGKSYLYCRWKNPHPRD